MILNPKNFLSTRQSGLSVVKAVGPPIYKPSNCHYIIFICPIIQGFVRPVVSRCHSRDKIIFYETFWTIDKIKVKGLVELSVVSTSCDLDQASRIMLREHRIRAPSISFPIDQTISSLHFCNVLRFGNAVPYS